MIDLWYFNTKNISQEEVSVLLKLFPTEIINEINRLKNHSDRRLKLFGKLMIKKFFEEKEIDFKWCEWNISNSGKPRYKTQIKFNISHSKDFVVVAFSDYEIGIDIEEIVNFELDNLTDYFHPKEVQYIEDNHYSANAFFRLWTRKEAYLKAIGKGIIEGLDNENCLSDKLINEQIWFLYSLSTISNYHLAVCTPIRDCQINIKELCFDEFNI